MAIEKIIKSRHSFRREKCNNFSLSLDKPFFTGVQHSMDCNLSKARQFCCKKKKKMFSRRVSSYSDIFESKLCTLLVRIFYVDYKFFFFVTHLHAQHFHVVSCIGSAES